MKNMLALSFVALGMTAFAASNNSYKVELLQDSVIEGKSFKAGEYKISLQNGTAMIKQGKEVVEVPAHEEAQPQKVYSTVIKYKDGTNVQEISVGGTHSKIIFDGGSAARPGA
jgi:hypothetical protein